MPLNLRHAIRAGCAGSLLLLLEACSSGNVAAPAAPVSPAPSSAPVITVSVSGSVTVTLGTTAQYAATVTGATNQTVSWTVDQVAGGNAQSGTISTTGLYTAPAIAPTPGMVTIAAISAADATASNGLAVTLKAAPVGPAPGPVSATAAARLLDQITFGPTAAGIAHVQQIGLQAALTEQFNQAPTLYSQPPSPDAECKTNNFTCTQSDFLKVSAFGADQLRQRVAMALSEIWVAPTRSNNAMPYYLNLLAQDAFTNYRTIMQDATLSPQMGGYLNMANSGKPSNGQIANENFGREMMQLFSLGPNLLEADGTTQIDSNGNMLPAYTESEVEAFARAYTGWTYANADGSAPSGFNFAPNFNHAMVPVENLHDGSAKILLLGTTLPAGQTAEQDLKDALDNIFAHPNIGPFLCRQLIQHLVSSNPSPAYVARVADVFANNGTGVRGDMRAVLTSIIMDPEARAGDAQTGDEAASNPTVDGGHLREPLLWTVNLLRALGAQPTNPQDAYPFVYLMTEFLGTMEEAPFTQSSVFNYFSPQYVIPQTTINAPEFGLENTGMIEPRQSVANAIAHNAATGLMIDLSATSPMGKVAADPAALSDYLSMLFMHSQMPTDMRSGLIATIAAIPATNLQSRVEVAVYLVVTSAQYKIMH